MIGNCHQGGFILQPTYWLELPMYWLELSLSDKNFKNREHFCFAPDCTCKEITIKI